MQGLIIKGEILSPIHIRSGQERDGLDFIVEENTKLLHIVDQHRISKAINQHKINKEALLQIIQNGNFQKLHSIKSSFPKDFWEIKQSFSIGDKALKTLGQQGNSSNQGIIKQQYIHPFTGKVIIPGSTIKGILRTAYLYDYLQKNKTGNISGDEKKLKDFDHIEGELNENLFKRIQCEDVIIENDKHIVQVIQSRTKPKKNKNTKKFTPKFGPSVNIQTIIHGNFDININLSLYGKSKGLENIKEDIKENIKNYSHLLIRREEQIIKGIGYGYDFLDKLNKHLSEGKYPIKIGMFKKSLAYKLRREEMLAGLPQGPRWKDEARRKGVGDKTIYLDEEGIPVGRIILSLPI